MDYKNNKGFLLVGLIIVIAIIAILIAISLSSTNNTKQHPDIVQYDLSGKDVAMEEDMGVLITNSFVYYGSYANYNGFCDNTATKNVYNSIISENKYCNDNFGSWVVCARLSADNTKAWCVDSAGKKGQISDSLCKNGLVVCP